MRGAWRARSPSASADQHGCLGSAALGLDAVCQDWIWNFSTVVLVLHQVGTNNAVRTDQRTLIALSTVLRVPLGHTGSWVRVALFVSGCGCTTNNLFLVKNGHTVRSRIFKTCKKKRTFSSGCYCDK